MALPPDFAEFCRRPCVGLLDLCHEAAVVGVRTLNPVVPTATPAELAAALDAAIAVLQEAREAVMRG